MCGQSLTDGRQAVHDGTLSGKVLTEVWAQTRPWELGQKLEAAGHLLSDVGKHREEQVKDHEASMLGMFTG